MSLAVSLSRDLFRIDLETVHVDAQLMVCQNVSKVFLICCQSIFGFDLCPGRVLRVSNCRTPDTQDFLPRRIFVCYFVFTEATDTARGSHAELLVVI